MKDWLDRVFPHLRDRVRVRVLGLAVAVGVLGGLSAVAFEFSMDAVSEVVFGEANPALGGFSGLRAVVGAVLAGLCTCASMLLLSDGRPRTMADTIGHARGANEAPRPRDALASALTAVLTIGGGQSAGREGPIVQIAGSAAAYAGERLRVPPASARVLSAAGAAGAIAASFNSPLGGAFFALEVILGTFAVEAFAPVVVASVAGTVVGQLLLGARLALKLPYFRLHHWSEILLFPVLGILCGLVTIAFRALVALSKQQLSRLPAPGFVHPALSGLFVGLLAVAGMPDVMGNGYARLEVLLGGEEQDGLAFLALLLGAKLVATAISTASRSGGGMFAPSLFLGAVTGLLCGRVFGVLLPGVQSDPGTFATVGMAGVAAALAHAPATMALMMAEMTGNYAIVLPALVTIAIASLVTQTAFRHSLYIQTLLDRGLRFDRNREELVVEGLRVADVMTEEGYLTAPPDLGFDELARLFLENRRDEVFVVDAGGRLVGLVDLQDVKGLLRETAPRDGLTARKLARTAPATRADASVAEVMQSFYETGLESLPVLDADGKLAGVVTERDVMGALNREIVRRGVGEARIVSGPPDDRRSDVFELPEGHAVTSIPAADVAGRSLADLDLPKRAGVVVLAIDVWDEAEGRARRVPPRADAVLGPRDGLVVMGPADQLDRLPPVPDETALPPSE